MPFNIMKMPFNI